MPFPQSTKKALAVRSASEGLKPRSSRLRLRGAISGRSHEDQNGNGTRQDSIFVNEVSLRRRETETPCAGRSHASVRGGHPQARASRSPDARSAAERLTCGSALDPRHGVMEAEREGCQGPRRAPHVPAHVRVALRGGRAGPASARGHRGPFTDQGDRAIHAPPSGTPRSSQKRREPQRHPENSGSDPGCSIVTTRNH
jgi:hypothetical protein